MNASRKHLIVIIAVFIAIVAGIFLSKYFDFGTADPQPRYEKYEQGSRLERIREGLVKE